MKLSRIPLRWSELFVNNFSYSERWAITIIVSTITIMIDYAIHQLTGMYFSSLTLIAVVAIALYCGKWFGLLTSITLSLIMDYFYIQPLGSVLNTSQSLEHFIILVGFGIFVAFLADSLRPAFNRTLLANQNVSQAKLDAELARHKSELANDSMETMLAMISHDIKNPLSVVKLGTQLIQSSPTVAEEKKPILNMMVKNIEQIESMLASLLDISLMKNGKLTHFESHTCNLTDEISQIVDLLNFSEKHAIVYESPGTLWGLWSISSIRRILQNLVGNAAKYGAKDKPINIKVHQEEGCVRIDVHNEGPTISEEDQKEIFMAFRRTSDSNSNPKIKGWGLGLALVKGLAEAHGGSVSVVSNKQAGTCFSVQLKSLPQNQESHTNNNDLTTDRF